MLDTVLTPLKLIPRLLGLIKMSAQTAGYDSLNDYVKMTRVEPLVLLDEETSHLPYIEDVLRTNLSIFAATYLQGVALSVNIGKVNVMRLLDKLNPNRSIKDTAVFATESLMNANNYRFGLPKFGVALEADTPYPKVNGVPMVSIEVPEEKEEKKESGARFGKDVYTTISSEVNLAVGMVLEVDIESEGHKATIPVTLRLITNQVSPDTFVQIFSTAGRAHTAKERYHGWRSGELELWNDVILCRDLLDAHRKTLINDKTGSYAEIMRRRQSNRVSSFISGNPSVATASNIAVISTSTLLDIETTIGGRVKDFKTREQLFDKTFLMTLVVIDPRYEQVTFYHRGLQMPTQVSVKSLKPASKGKGMDVAEILRAFQLGQAPRF